MNILSKIIFCLIILGSFAQLKAQKINLIKGTLLSLTDSTPIGQAHVINLSAKNGVISNDQGSFSITPQPNDSISISSIGYKTIYVLANELSTNIYLEERNYQLELFNVMPYKTFQEFKIAFAKLNLPDTTRKINSTIYLSREELSGMGHNGSGLIVSGVVSSIFAAFNKRMKDKANYELLLLRDEYEAFLATKFNAELVAKITELKDNEKLNDFINYCDFSNDFIANNNNYDIITQTFECYDEYISLPLASN